MDSKALAKQFLKQRQVEQVNRLADEQVAEAREDEIFSTMAEIEEDRDINTIPLDQLLR